MSSASSNACEQSRRAPCRLHAVPLLSVVALLATLSASTRAPAAATAREGTLDGQPAITLENTFIRAVFAPGAGGHCVDFVYKPIDKPMLLRRTGALLGNRVWNYADTDLYKQWQTTAWEHRLERRPGEVRLVMQANGRVDFTRATMLEKSVTLRDREAVLRVTHTFHVGQELMNPRTIGLWFANRVGIPGERTFYSFPLDDGIATLDFAASSGQSWFYNPARGWIAMHGDSGAGLAFGMEYRRLMCFYLCQGKQPTVEWAFRTMDIKNGESFATEELLIPFAGLKAVHGCGEDVVACFEAPDRFDAGATGKQVSITARLTSGSTREATLTVVLRPLPEGPDIPVGNRDIRLAPGELTSERFSAPVPAPGTWLLIGTLAQAEREVMDFLYPISVGADGARVCMAPKEERLGRVSERFEDRKPLRGSAPKDLTYSTAIETPHVKWAKPYAGGRLKVLVLTSCIAGREAAELAQRLDLELLWVSAGTQYELNSLGYLFNTPERRGVKVLVEHMNEAIHRVLSQQPCDAVIIGGLSGALFSEQVIALLQQKIDAGMGLVYVAPNRGPDSLYAFLPVAKETHLRHRNGQWTAVSQPDHFITAGIPFGVLPRTDYALYQATGDVLATVANAPLLVVQDGPGSGRVVVLTYNSGWQGVGAYSCGMTPWIETPDCDFDYWEYHFSLLAKALVWSAHRESQIRLLELRTEGGDAQPPKLFLSLQNEGSAVSARVQARVSNAFSRVHSTVRRELDIAPGGSVVDVPLPGGLPDGLHLVDVSVRDKQDRVLAWGSTQLTVSRPLQLTELSVDKRAYAPDDTVRATVLLTSRRAQQGPVLVQARLLDALGRLVAAAERQVTPDAENRLVLELPLGKPLVTTATCHVAAVLDGDIQAEAETTFITFPESFVDRQPADWEHRIWGSPAGAYSRPFTARACAQQLKVFMADCVLASSNWLYDREFEWPVRAGFRIMPMGASFGYISVGHRVPKGKMTFAEQRQNYQVSHDKQYLVRPICLNDAQDLQPLAEKLQELADFAGWLEPSDYNLGDEMSTTYYVTPMDYDFAPAALEAFREWLKGQYAGLAALNREWGTAFTTWPEVVPLTAEEVKERGNYAPWADHREFMDVSFANFFAWVREQLRTRDPKAKVSLSGSQAAEAYGGYDWRRLSQALDFVQNYTHQNTVIMQRSFGPELPRAPWYGYGVFNPGLRHTLWWRLFHGNFGGSYFSLASLLKPDLTFSQTAAQALPLVREFKSGLALLLQNVDRSADVGVHYSHASIRGAYVTGVSVAFRENRMGWIKAFEDLGYQCEFLSTDQIEAGELATRNYPVFLLPYSIALSAKEADALRQYVADGGLLIADGRTGLMDTHCKPVARPQLDELFGVARTSVEPLAPLRPGEAVFAGDASTGALNGLRLDADLIDSSLELKGGKALGTHGGEPIGIVRRSGKGATVYLNLMLDSYLQRRKLKLEEPVQQLIAQLPLLNGVRPAMRITAEDGSKPRWFIVRYRDGAATYTGCLLEPGEGNAEDLAPFTLHLPEEGNVIDLRQRRDVSRTQTVPMSLAAGDAALFAVLPYRVSAVQLEPGKGTMAPGETVTVNLAVKTDGGPPEKHVILFEVIGPDGKVREHYGKKLLAERGQATASFTYALNDTPGAWTVKATDFVTGTSGRCSVRLQAR